MFEDDLNLDFGADEYVRFRPRSERRRTPHLDETQVLPAAEATTATPSRRTYDAEFTRSSHRGRQPQAVAKQRAFAMKVGGGVAVAVALLWAITAGVGALHLFGGNTGAAASSTTTAAAKLTKSTKAKKKRLSKKRSAKTASASSSSTSTKHVASASSAKKAVTVAAAAPKVVKVSSVSTTSKRAPSKPSTKKAAARAPNSRGTITIETFGYSFSGPPSGAKLVADVRNIQAGDFKQSENGLMASVRARVMATSAAKQWLSTFENDWTPRLKNGDLVAIGCARGHHRSVTLAWEYRQYLQAHGWTVNLVNRDIYKTW